MPETIMNVSAQFAATGKSFHGSALPDGLISVDQIEDAAIEDEEPAIDQASFIGRLLLERRDAVALDADCTEPARRTHGRDSGQGPMCVVEGQGCLDIDVGDSIAISQGKNLVVPQIFGGPLDPSAGLRGFAGVDERYTPGLCALSM